MGFAPLIPIIATGLGGIAQISGGISANNQARAEAAQYDQNAKSALTAADQSESLRRQDLISTLSSIDAVRTARGLDVASPTGQVIAQNRTARAEQGIDTENLNYRTQAQSYKTQAGISRSQGSAALLGGFLKGGASLFSAGSDAYNYGKKT
jgi:hypothetical protein